MAVSGVRFRCGAWLEPRMNCQTHPSWMPCTIASCFGVTSPTSLTLAFVVFWHRNSLTHLPSKQVKTVRTVRTTTSLHLLHSIAKIARKPAGQPSRWQFLPVYFAWLVPFGVTWKRLSQKNSSQIGAWQRPCDCYKSQPSPWEPRRSRRSTCCGWGTFSMSQVNMEQMDRWWWSGCWNTAFPDTKKTYFAPCNVVCDKFRPKLKERKAAQRGEAFLWLISSWVCLDSIPIAPCQPMTLWNMKGNVAPRLRGNGDWTSGFCCRNCRWSIGWSKSRLGYGIEQRPGRRAACAQIARVTTQGSHQLAQLQLTWLSLLYPI